MKSQAIVAYGKPLEEVTSDIPRPRARKSSSRSPTRASATPDVHLQDGHVDIGDGDKIDWSKGRTLPHASATRSKARSRPSGPDAQGLLEGRKLGQRFVVFPWIGCGECATCKRDQEHICSKPRQLGIQVAGGYSEYVLVPHPKYLLDATGVPERSCRHLHVLGHHARSRRSRKSAPPMRARPSPSSASAASA